MNEKELIYFVDKLSTKPSDINEHLPTLLEYGKKCETIIEFGVRWPTSTWALLLSKPKIMKSYDILDPSNWNSSITPVIETAKEIGVDYEFIISSSLEIEIISTDLLFIDTLHCYNQLRQELALHHDKVNKYIIMHDTTLYNNHDEGSLKQGCTGEGLQKAVDEFLLSHNNWKVDHIYTNNNGLTILINENIL